MSDPQVMLLENKLLVQMYGRSFIPGFGDVNAAADLTGGLNVGRGGMEEVHAAYPNEFEYYAIALELVDSQMRTERFFSFPVMPNSMNIAKAFNTSYTKTMGGVVVNTNPTFTPFDISLVGTFGRKLRRVYNNGKDGNIQQAKASKDATTLMEVEFHEKRSDEHVFSSDYKSGYACLKMLERILTQTQMLDKFNGAYKLILYNLSFNQRYMVEPVAFTPNMTRDVNRVWHYTLNLKAVAPADAVLDNQRLGQSLKNITDFNRKQRNYANHINKIVTVAHDAVNLGPNHVYNTMKKLQGAGAALVGTNGEKPNALKALKQLAPANNNMQNFILKTNRQLITGY